MTIIVEGKIDAKYVYDYCKQVETTLNDLHLRIMHLDKKLNMLEGSLAQMLDERLKNDAV